MSGKTAEAIHPDYNTKFRGLLESVRTQKADLLEDIESRNKHRASTSHHALSSSMDSKPISQTKQNLLYNPQRPPSPFDLPESWSPMSVNEDFGLIDISYLSPEYMEIIRDFKANMNGIKVIYFKVQRVQSKSLYESYLNHLVKLRRKIYEENEMILWHGVKNESVKDICMFGFTNNYCSGRNGHKNGYGVYFSTNSSYAHQFTDISTENGDRKIFRARVLAGKSTVGNESMRMPPLKPNGDHYDSTCDTDKTLFVVYDDCQSFPEYLISYKAC